MIKKTITIIVTLLFGILALQAQKSMDSFEVQVDGLGCPFCAYGLEKKFKEFKGIKKVAIDIETGDFSFQYPAERTLAMSAVIAQVKKAGYTPNEAKIIRANGATETSAGVATALNTESVVVSEQLFISGKCGMCQARIEHITLAIPGITTAVWNQENQKLEVAYDKTQTTIDNIEKEIAMAGHDTKNHLATATAYNNLPVCCHYTRLEQ